jgi:hypothetical protein
VFILGNLGVIPKVTVADPALEGPTAPRAPAVPAALTRTAPRLVARALAQLPGTDVASAAAVVAATPALPKVAVTAEERASGVDGALAVDNTAARGRRRAVDRAAATPTRLAKALCVDSAGACEYCPVCNAAVEHAEGWRLTVRLCISCERFVHLACATRGRNFVCSTCK